MSRTSFDWADPFDLESQLTEEERLVQKTAHAYAQDRLAPRVLEGLPRGEDRPVDLPRNGRTRLSRADGLARFRRRRPRLCRLWPDRARGRARRQRLSLDDVGAVLAGDDRRSRRSARSAQKEKYLPKLATRRMDRLLRPDRARSRLRPRLDGHARARRSPAATASPARRPGSPTRRSPTSSWSGPRPRTASSAASCWRRARRASSAPAIHGKVGLRASITGEIVLDDAFVPEENLLPGVHRPEGSVHLPERGALRHRLGRARRGGGLLRDRAAIRARPQAVRPPARRQPAHPEEARRHGDRDRAGAAGLPAARPHEGGRPSAGRADLDPQAQFLRQGAGDRPRRARHARRQRHLRRIRASRAIW